MAAQGLPVPEGIVIPCRASMSASACRAVEALLRDGPVIARAAMRGEDTVQGSAAGLGLSLGGLYELAAVRDAVRRIVVQRGDPTLVRQLGPPTDRDRIVVQHQVPARWLVVGALLVPEGDYVECHRDPEADVLSSGASPTWAGAVTRWDDPAADEVAALCRQVRRVHPPSPHGLDVEIVLDPGGGAHLVQVRPMVADPTPGWPDFVATLDELGALPLPEGVLVLDAEHNPAPLSPAHTWLMHRLAHARPGSGAPVVLAGWLYVRTLVRDLAGRPSPGGRPASATVAVRRLVQRHLPEARKALARIEQSLEHAGPEQTADTLEPAFDAFLAMIDVYLGELVPARRAMRQRVVRPDDPLTTRDRGRHLDVLPATWDLASASLAELTGGSQPTDAPSEVGLPSDEAEAATLLTEWDDHLFALGLAPLRRVYSRAGEVLGLGQDVFLLEGDELAALLRGEDDEVIAALPQRRADLERFAALRPPLRIEDGAAVPIPPRRHLRGIPIGERFEGPIAQREDLEHLLRDPPSPNAIVVMPALTAQAAVAVQTLGLRAVCCEHGGAMSHAALMARELGLSALIGCQGVTHIPTETRALLDPHHARLWLL